MQKGENINQEIVAGLNSADEKIVAQTIRELRVHGNIDLLPAVFSLFFSSRMEILNEELVNLLNDIKDPLAVPVFVEALKTYRGHKGFDKLVSACWQSGLNFSAHIDQFIDLVIEEDYYTSLEAFSVIEENVSLLNSQQKSARIEFIRSRLEFLSPEKKSLVNEMISLLSTVTGPFRLDTDHLN